MTDRRDDSTLVVAARDGETQAFEALVRRHLPAVYGHALRFFGDPASAEDATQEVFVKAYRSLGSFDGRSSFGTWLFRVTRNVCVDLFRQAKRRPVPVDPFDSPVRSAPDFSSALVDRVAVERAMTALAPEDRDALNAVSLFGLSYEEAAGVLGVPTGTVKSRVFRARKVLVTVLAKEGGA